MVVTTKISTEGLTVGGCGSSSCSGYGGGRGFGNGFGNGNECCANGLPAQLNNDYGRELLMQAIQGNRSAIHGR